MKSNLSIIILFLSGMLVAQAAPEGFERYKVILDRKPFGEPPIVVDPPAEPLAETPPWAAAYRLVSVTKVEGGDVRVGILDTKSNKALVLKVGEMEDGIELLAADVLAENAELRKGGEVVTMDLKAANPGTRPKPAVTKANSNKRRVVKPRGRRKPSARTRNMIRKRVPRPPGT